MIRNNKHVHKSHNLQFAFHDIRAVFKTVWKPNLRKS